MNTAEQIDSREISWDEFATSYLPEPNIMSEDIEDSHLGQYLFAVGGEEGIFVRSVAAESPDRVWTMLSTPSGEVIVNGFYRDNAMAYLVTSMEFGSESIEVEPGL